ncbi:polyprotein [Lakamha virus]|uniref:Polyprotein n=1 Tax=Lakamha virus TaxID=2609059 RepID=A0A5C2D379_9VIRU|nr:polyprotein [Lakamha virus]QEO75952.1 polyprotein [Lakamha virus]
MRTLIIAFMIILTCITCHGLSDDIDTCKLYRQKNIIKEEICNNTINDVCQMGTLNIVQLYTSKTKKHHNIKAHLNDIHVPLIEDENGYIQDYELNCDGGLLTKNYRGNDCNIHVNEKDGIISLKSAIANYAKIFVNEADLSRVFDKTDDFQLVDEISHVVIQCGRSILQKTIQKYNPERCIAKILKYITMPVVASVLCTMSNTMAALVIMILMLFVLKILKRTGLIIILFPILYPFCLIMYYFNKRVLPKCTVCGGVMHINKLCSKTCDCGQQFSTTDAIYKHRQNNKCKPKMFYIISSLSLGKVTNNLIYIILVLIILTLLPVVKTEIQGNYPVNKYFYLEDGYIINGYIPNMLYKFEFDVDAGQDYILNFVAPSGVKISEKTMLIENIEKRGNITKLYVTRPVRDTYFSAFGCIDNSEDKACNSDADMIKIKGMANIADYLDVKASDLDNVPGTREGRCNIGVCNSVLGTEKFTVYKTQKVHKSILKYKINNDGIESSRETIDKLSKILLEPIECTIVESGNKLVPKMIGTFNDIDIHYGNIAEPNNIQDPICGSLQVIGTDKKIGAKSISGDFSCSRWNSINSCYRDDFDKCKRLPILKGEYYLPVNEGMYAMKVKSARMKCQLVIKNAKIGNIDQDSLKISSDCTYKNIKKNNLICNIDITSKLNVICDIVNDVNSKVGKLNIKTGDKKYKYEVHAKKIKSIKLYICGQDAQTIFKDQNDEKLNTIHQNYYYVVYGNGPEKSCYSAICGVIYEISATGYIIDPVLIWWYAMLPLISLIVLSIILTPFILRFIYKFKINRDMYNKIR